MDPSPRSSRSRIVPVSCLFLVLGLAAVVACSADEAKEAAIRELAIGSWACAPDEEGASSVPFAVEIDDDGTFVVSPEDDPAVDDGLPPGYEFSGTWAIEDGDLEWALVDVARMDEVRIEGFEDLTLESTRFTLDDAGMFEANDGPDDPVGEQDVIVDTHGTDSVTLRYPDGDPWTCDRQ